NKDGLVSSIDEDNIKEKHYRVYRYLYNKINILQSRSLQGNTKWYEFSRSQSLNSVYLPKILIREMMPKAMFSADTKGEFVFSSGYALIGKDMTGDQLVVWASILSTPTMEYFMRHIGTQLHSGWFRLMKSHLSNLKLPNLSCSDFVRIKKEVEKNRPSNQIIDSFVSAAFGLTEEENNFIKNNLLKIHKKSRPNETKLSEDVKNRYEPVKLNKYDNKHIDREDLKQSVTFSQNKKIPIHNWYKFTQGFSPNLVNTILDEFGIDSKSKVLDPFSGCGTTLVACAYRGVKSVGIEISPLLCIVARIKARRWNIEKLRNSFELEYLSFNRKKTNLVFYEYFKKAYSEKILKQLLELSSFIKSLDDDEVKDFYTIGLLSILEDISKIRKHGSHYRYLDNSKSVGLQKLNINIISEDVNVYDIFIDSLRKIYGDICVVGGNPKRTTKIINSSSLNTKLKSQSIDAIITSPPYLNRNNYIAQQKAELDILDLVTDKLQYKSLVKSTFRSHTDSNLAGEPRSKHKEINLIIENMELASGNNPKIPHMICGYFDDLEASLKESYRLLKPGSKSAFVVGNTRWGGVVVPIDHILAQFAERIGFVVNSIYVTRLKGNSPQQMKRFGKIPVRESIVILSKP
ncbi:MAG: hypothetical protein J7L15_04325, partial [Clostridiales bacterium]|nr:hypothetical protein [Clostridiales bacterium]